MNLDSIKKQFKNGIIDDNPVLVQLLGMCPTLAITTSLKNGIGMGISATIVLIFSNVIISLLRKFIPNKIRIAAYIVIIAGLVTIMDISLQAYFPELSKSLGLFIPLIVVNCIIFARVESCASKNNVIVSLFDGISMGLGFTIALMIVSSIREILGNGTLLGFSLFGTNFEPALVMILPAGAFLTLGVVIAAVNFLKSKASLKGVNTDGN